MIGPCWLQLALIAQTLSTILSGMSGPPGQGYPPSYPPAQRPAGGPHEGYGGPGYNNYPGHGGPPPGWNAHPPTSGNDVYNRGGYPGYPPRPYPGPGPQTGPPPPTSSSSGTPPPAPAPVSQPYDQYQVRLTGTLHPSVVCRIFCSSCLIMHSIFFHDWLLECN